MDRRQLKKYIQFYALERLFRDSFVQGGDLQEIYSVRIKNAQGFRDPLSLNSDGYSLLVEIFDIQDSWRSRKRRDRPPLSKAKAVRFLNLLEEMIEDARDRIDDLEK